jgi:ribosomal protein S18 acetylase RimI-like enzyme
LRNTAVEMAIADPRVTHKSGRMSHASLRMATGEDVDLILELIQALADFENLGDQVEATREQLVQSLFGERPVAEVILIFEGAASAGFAVFHPNFSTFLGKPGLHLEDLYIRPEFRGRGHGRALLQHLAQLAVERGYGRFEWTVLEWNELAIGFYRRQGAEILPEWRICRVTGEALDRLAKSSPRKAMNSADTNLLGGK